jgi:preprotein translocase subunit YajC
MLIFFGVMILIFWLLIIRPQQKQKKKQEQFLSSLKSGDKVVTSAGFIGRIVKVEGEEAELELARDVRVRVLKSSIAGRQGEGESKPS